MLTLTVRLHRPGVASQGMTISNTAAVNSVNIRVRGTATVVDVKRAIIRATSGAFVPDSLIINGRRVNTASSLGSLQLFDGAVMSAHAAPEYGAPFTTSVKFGVHPYKTVFLLAGRKDKVETLLWRIYRDHGVSPSSVSVLHGTSFKAISNSSSTLIPPVHLPITHPHPNPIYLFIYLSIYRPLTLGDSLDGVAKQW